MRILDIISEEKTQFLEDINNMREIYVDKSLALTNTFCSSFFSLVSEFSAIDAKESFYGTNCRSNLFKRYVKYMDDERKRRFFNTMAMHHTIQMLAKKRDKLNFYILSVCLYDVYGFKENEKKFFEILYKYRMSFPRQFPDIFSKAAVKYIFNIDEEDIFSIAFFENFCYNSFNIFLKYFSEYISINRRIKISNTEQAAGA